MRKALKFVGEVLSKALSSTLLWKYPTYCALLVLWVPIALVIYFVCTIIEALMEFWREVKSGLAWKEIKSVWSQKHYDYLKAIQKRHRNVG